MRPTLDRVKESIFSVIGSQIRGAKVLDLFSGTGSLGLESLSRGCGLVHFVDKEVQSIDLIRYNTENLISGVPGTGVFKIIKSDVLDYLEFCKDIKWDIIFLDPPYRVEPEIMKKAFGILSEKRVTTEDTLMIYEYFFKKEIEEEIENLKIVKESFFGDKKVVYLKLKSNIT
ncbi:MAG: 16S rRNA (guanine(966)-N(2))-methyltransferase RsmD [Actinobacteria bacterium]|nr:16S rRNA (guanine(966)-N(2))-methyltransferase RsmD [Actinomycetota bacterium]